MRALRVLGFDYGTQKIGVASGQTATGTASGIAILPARDGIPDWAQIERLLKEWQPALLVVGLPLNMDGSESELSARARKFGNRLHGRTGLPVEMWDERLSSREARELARDSGRGREQVDALAAALVLESWLAAQTS